ncbi:MAG: 16S rRNA (cytosine(1402)-N(4))-methyltransferase RsmH [Candidatus Magnetoovum sp. WYHC-5]|nr:16S rRNA (cytosine(1402)-N(4))-methyltransferase RsmH [Candidatus Magnetoovum sp. WYHC-5]
MLNVLNKRNGLFVDCTVGAGGHGGAILANLGERGRYIGIDQDNEILAVAKSSINDERAMFYFANFTGLKDVLEECGYTKADGILFDLGVSMYQLKNHTRGFSFESTQRLDMRMDTNGKELSAWDVVNCLSEEEIVRILRDFGQETRAKLIGRLILQRRKDNPINTCLELSELIVKAYGGRWTKRHPATKSFQAIRIYVNRELEVLQEALDSALGVLNTGGRLCVISYHSLEDRIVKHSLRQKNMDGQIALLTKKPLCADENEVRENPSARSAKLRGGQKI